MSAKGLPWCLGGKESACNAGEAGNAGSVPRLGRSPGGGHGNPLQYSCYGKTAWTEEPGGLQSMGLQRVRWAEMTEHAGTNER